MFCFLASLADLEDAGVEGESLRFLIDEAGVGATAGVSEAEVEVVDRLVLAVEGFCMDVF